MIVGLGLDKLKLSPDDSIRDAIKVINDGALQIALVVDSDQILLGVVTDGDVRRWLLRDLPLHSPIKLVMNKSPVVALHSILRDDVFKLMEAYKIQQIPIVDSKNKLIGLHVWNASNKIIRSNFFVIMAGGLGTRLMPFTKDCPKPMLLVHGKPILERIILKAKEQGFENFIICVNYLSHIIQDYFGDGAQFGVNIEYIKEKDRLGTIGALSLCDSLLKSPFIVTNGDVLTEINYSNLLDFHIRNELLGVMAVKLHEIQNPYGVVVIDGHRLVSFEEKPVYQSYINAGVYALSPEVLRFLKFEEYCDAPTLFSSISAYSPSKSGVYLIEDEWIDIGRVDDFHAANRYLDDQ